MMEFFKNLFSQEFMPHGHCLFWKTELLRLYVIGDGLTAIAYYTIPIAIAYFVCKRKDIAFKSIFVLFAIFIVLCGTTHLMFIWTLWNPMYRLEIVIKLLTAVVSVATAIIVWPIIYKALTLPSPAQLRKVNEELTQEINNHKRTENQLKELSLELETKVEERTENLVAVNRKLKEEITERNLVEEALQDEREYTEHIVSAAPNLICGIALDGTTVFVNEAVFKITGYTREEIQGKNWWKVFYPGEEYRQAEQLLKKLRNGKVVDYEMVLTTKNKEKRALSWNTANRYDKHRELLQIIGIGTDITERKKSEMQISEHNTILNAINKIFKEALTCETEEDVAQVSLAMAQELTDSKFGFYGEINKDGLFDTIALSDPGWDACKIPETNAVVLINNMKIHGIYGSVLKGEKSQIVNDPGSHPDQIGTPEGHPPLNTFLGVPLKRAGKTIGMIALANKESGYNLDDQKAIEVLSVAFVESLSSKRAEIMLKKAYDELENNVAERTSEIKEKADKLEKSEKALLYLLEDVNEIRDNLEKANIKLKELDQLKSMFIASMSHELRTPLNSIIGFTGIILQGIDGEINPQQNDHIGRVNRSAKHLLALINDIIDLSKVEAGKIDVFLEDIVLDEVINEAVDSVRLQANEKGFALYVSVPPGVRMNTDRRRLYQCILNYLSNAVKFTEAGTISITAHDTNGEVEIIVSDTGIGISDEDQQRLFLPFVRIDSHLRAKTLGTGLGLYLTRKLTTELLGGTVDVQSQPGKGSTFTLRLPKVIKKD